MPEDIVAYFGSEILALFFPFFSPFLGLGSFVPEPLVLRDEDFSLTVHALEKCLVANTRPLRMPLAGEIVDLLAHIEIELGSNRATGHAEVLELGTDE